MWHLTDEQISEFENRLLSARESALAVLNEAARSRPVEASGSTIGRLTRIDALQIEAMSQMNRHQLEIRLKQIEASLAALEAETYGICRNCKGPIAFARLDAVPEAPFCLTCQEGFES